MNKEELQDFKMEIERLYNEYLEKTENRNTSYGELIYIDNLNEKELNEMYNELLEELESE